MSNKDSSEIKVTDLTNSSVDYLTAFGKAIVGAAPLIGSGLGEIIGASIPKQRMDRIVQFVGQLDERLQRTEIETLRLRFEDENVRELIEEAILQASRSTSNERRGYLASIVANGIKAEQVTVIGARHLLTILRELNDLEVLWLRRYYGKLLVDDNEFMNNHLEIFRTPLSDDEIIVQRSYRQHLARLQLIDRVMKFDAKTATPVYDEILKSQSVQGYRVTVLGVLILRETGAIKSSIELKKPKRHETRFFNTIKAITSPKSE